MNGLPQANNIVPSGFQYLRFSLLEGLTTPSTPHFLTSSCAISTPTSNHTSLCRCTTYEQYQIYLERLANISAHSSKIFFLTIYYPSLGSLPTGNWFITQICQFWPVLAQYTASVFGATNTHCARVHRTVFQVWFSIPRRQCRVCRILQKVLGNCWPGRADCIL